MLPTSKINPLVGVGLGRSIDLTSVTITQIIPTPLANLRLENAENLNQQLKVAILAEEARHSGVSHSNLGGWQSRDDLLSWGGDAAQILISSAREFANTLSAIWDPVRGLIEADLDWSCNAWANVNRKGDANTAHAHPGAYWSGVYWVDDGMGDEISHLGGEIEFFDPRGAAPVMVSGELKMRIDGCLSAGLKHQVQPREGNLLLFPSWLTHSVNTYLGSRPRISVAMNFMLPALSRGQSSLITARR